MKPLTPEEIFARTPLRPPYFAFTEVAVTNGEEIIGRLTPEQPMEAEAGEIAAAEVGRHLAILGSVAASRLLEGPHYLLATQAHLRAIAPDRRIQPP